MPAIRRERASVWGQRIKRQDRASSSVSEDAASSTEVSSSSIATSTRAIKNPKVVMNPKNQAHGSITLPDATVITINEPTVLTLAPTAVVFVTATVTIEAMDTTASAIATDDDSATAVTQTRSDTSAPSRPTQQPSFGPSSSDGDMFNGATSAPVKIVTTDESTLSTSADAAETSSAPTATSIFATATEQASSPISDSVPLSASTTAPVSTSAEVIESSASNTAVPQETLSGSTSVRQSSQVPQSSSGVVLETSFTTAATALASNGTYSATETPFESTSIRVAAVRTSDTSIQPLVTSIPLSSASSSSPTATSVAVSISEDRIFSVPSSRIRAVEISASSAVASYSSAAASRSSELAIASRSIVSAASSLSSAAAAASSLSLVLASKSQSVFSDGPEYDGPTPAPHTIKATPTASVRYVTHTMADGSTVVTAEQVSDADHLFGTIPRSPASIGLTVFVALLLSALVLGLAAFFFRRCRRRQRKVALQELESEKGSPQGRSWTNRDSRNDADSASNPFSDSYRSDGGETTGSDVQPEALWRRQIRRVSQTFFGRHNVQVAPLMPSTTDERDQSSDWTSFVGDRAWSESFVSRSRQGSKDSNAIMIESVTPSAENRHARLLAAVQNPHPLRTSYVPESPSMYSRDEQSMLSRGTDSTASPRALFNYALPPPTSSSLLPSPFEDSTTTPSNTSPRAAALKQSLDRLMGSAAEYIGGLWADDVNSERLTSFRSPRVAPPTPIIIPPTPRISSGVREEYDLGISMNPAVPERAATYTGAATLSPARASEMASLRPWGSIDSSSTTPSNSSDESPPPSPGFIGIAHAQLALGVRPQMQTLADVMMAGSPDPQAGSVEVVKEETLKDEAVSKDRSEDPFSDAAAVQDPLPPHNPPSSADRVDTPPPAAVQPRLSFLSPFSQRRLSAYLSDDSDDGTSTVRGGGSRRGSSSSATNTIRMSAAAGTTVAKRLSFSTPTPLRRSALHLNDEDGISDEDYERERHRRAGSPRSGSPIRLPQNVPIPASPAPSTTSTDTFGTRLSSSASSNGSDDGSDETADSGTSRALRARERRKSMHLELEATKVLMKERRRRSLGAIVTRVA